MEKPLLFQCFFLSFSKGTIFIILTHSHQGYSKWEVQWRQLWNEIHSYIKTMQCGVYEHFTLPLTPEMIVSQ